jgi:hypothetical protein
MSMLSLAWITVILSVGLVAAAWFAAPRESSRKPLIWMMGICGIAAIPLMLSAVLTLHFLIMAGLMIVWAIFGRRPAVLRTFAILAPIWPYTFGAMEIINDREKLARLRADYPVISVAERLGYEKPPADRPEAVADFAGTALAPAVLVNLVSQEERQGQVDYRNRIFETLHDETHDRFVGSMGFGPMRMAHMFRLPPDRKPPQSIDQPEPNASPPDDATPEAGTAVAVKAEPMPSKGPSRSMLDYLHAGGTLQFVDPDRVGYVKDRDHVVGFEPHRFDSLPQLDGASAGEWRLAKLELVSLLKHPEPRVYVSAHLPRMEELKDAPTRPLEPFEARSLPQLRTARDTVVEEAPNTVRMLGAVRAGKTCLECHSVKRGELLGAFSYVLRRSVPVPKPKSTRPAGEL